MIGVQTCVAGVQVASRPQSALVRQRTHACAVESQRASGLEHWRSEVHVTQRPEDMSQAGPADASEQSPSLLQHSPVDGSQTVASPAQSPSTEQVWETSGALDASEPLSTTATSPGPVSGVSFAASVVSISGPRLASSGPTAASPSKYQFWGPHAPDAPAALVASAKARHRPARARFTGSPRG